MSNIHLSDILDVDEFRTMLDGKYVTSRHYEGVDVFNYTNKAAFAREWNNTTRTCRGLVVDSETQEVLSRPFKKFFNWNEPESQPLPMTDDTLTVVHEKIDGSMVTMYRHPTKGWRFATKGSGDSEQAEEARRIWEDKYSEYIPPTGHTPVFEVVYPENRIIVNYGSERDLYLLGYVNIENGLEYGPETVAGIPFPTPKLLNVGCSLGDVLDIVAECDDKDNREGMVAWVTNGNADDGREHQKIKFKFSEYLLAHRFAFNVTPERLWKRQAYLDLVKSCGGDFAKHELRLTEDDIAGMEAVPEELYAEHEDYFTQLITEYHWTYQRHKTIQNELRLVSSTPEGTVDAEFASLVRDACASGELSEHVLFAMQKDNLSQYSLTWKAIKPE